MEDSAIFNFISSLSPIKPVKSAHLNSLNFASVPCIFTSPRLKESISLGRHNFPELSKPEISCVNGTKDAVDAAQLRGNSANSNLEIELLHPRDPIAKACFGPNNGISEIAIELLHTLEHGYGSPDCDPRVCDDTEAELVRAAASYVQTFESGGFDGELHLGGIHQTEQRREETDFDWDSLTFDSADLTFDSDFRGFIQELLDSGTSVPSCSDSCISTLDEQEALDASLAVNSLERETNSVEDGFQASVIVISEELSQTNPRNKRQKLKHDGETEGCKRCNCKKSKCLKLYCECFAAGVYCEGQCSCLECFNKPVHKDMVFATRKEIELRNPLAFAPKVVRSSNPLQEAPVSAQHRRGCNCKKSSCIKKYCECYQGGVGCSVNCRCEGCKNTFGRKNG